MIPEILGSYFYILQNLAADLFIKLIKYEVLQLPLLIGFLKLMSDLINTV